MKLFQSTKISFASLEIISNAYYPKYEEMDRSRIEINCTSSSKNLQKIFSPSLTWKQYGLPDTAAVNKIVSSWNTSRGMLLSQS